MRYKTIIILVITMILVFGISENTFAWSKGVKVNLPNFKVTFNETQIDNYYRKYPLIEYQGITYFPMTYYDSRFLGIETKWDSTKGLEINKTGITGGYRDYKGDINNGKTFSATVPTFNITINGKIINNKEEKYPLLIFRDITYFPLTWRFAVDEFGWEYGFDSKTGLVINSSNIKVGKLNLPIFFGDQIIGDGENYYYEGEKGIIYQASIDGSDQRKIYQLPVWSYGDGDTYVNYSLYKKDNSIWLRYHQGGTIMGSDHYIRLNPNGTYDEVESGYLTFKAYGNMTILVDQGVPPSPNNLSIKYEGKDNRKVGNPSYLYGWIWEIKDSTSGGAASDDIYLVDNHIYLFAFNTEEDHDFSRIHRVNLDTNMTTRVTNANTKSFMVDGDYIYYVSLGNLYRLSLHNGEENHIKLEGPIDGHGFSILNNKIYYVNSLNHELYVDNMKESLNTGAKVKQIIKEEEYVICIFDEEANNSPRIMVFDKDGKLVFKSSDTALNAFINNDNLVYLESTTNNIYTADLKTPN